MSEGDVIAVFSQYGEVVNINLVRDKTTGKTKGFCFLCYEDQRSTILAVDNLNGIKLLNRIIRVDHVADYKMPKMDETIDDVTKNLYEEGCAPKAIVKPEKDQERKIKKEVKKEKESVKKTKKKSTTKRNESRKKSRRDSPSSSSDSTSSSSDTSSSSTSSSSSSSSTHPPSNYRKTHIKREKIDRGYEKYERKYRRSRSRSKSPRRERERNRNVKHDERGRGRWTKT
jgi:RNA-binding motif X-linked protein 2